MSLATIIELVQDKVRADALGSLVTDQLIQRTLAQALIVYSADKPREASAEELASGDTIMVPTDWVEGLSSLVAVEYPVGQAPMATVAASAVRPYGGAVRIQLQDRVLATDTPVRVHYLAPHAADGSTVPAEHHNAIACWVAAELCRQAATRAAHDRDATISAAATQQGSQSGDLARRARDWLTQYRTQLGLPDPEQSTPVKAAGVVVTPEGDGHRRGRIRSSGL
ncbi:MAG: hypothetical protein E6Q67_13025 [Roseateles sp.]|nr:MAG: hypothetical protein E6Q67_13025 [Roseateles sp.]